MIEEVPYDDVLSIRRQAMYPLEDLEFVKLDDDNKALHIGYFLENKPVSVFSIFLQNRELQFRKFATLPDYQHKGYGSKLMEWIIAYTTDMSFRRVWCNARSNKTNFYKKFGFKETNDRFSKNGYDYVVMEFLLENKI